MVHLDGVAEINGTAHYNKFCQSFLTKKKFSLLEIRLCMGILLIYQYVGWKLNDLILQTGK